VTININIAYPSIISFMKFLKEIGPFKLNWCDNIKNGFVNMFLRILNWIASVQVIAQDGLFFCVGRDSFRNEGHAISWMSKAMKGDVPWYFMIVCSLVIEKDVAPTERSGLGQNIGWNFDREMYFQMKETSSLNPVSGNGMQTIKLVRGMCVVLLLL
jgi:hypothetical protein